MNYHVSYSNALTHRVDISLEVNDINSDFLSLHLPSWRPGRYEIANFAKNILKISTWNSSGEQLAIEKVTKDKWSVNTKGADSIRVDYVYYAHEMDAGNSWLDEEQLYLNFINCMLYVEDRMDSVHRVLLDVPKSYIVACGLKKEGNMLLAESYYQLVDSPMIASANLQCYEYSIEDTLFNIWINGSHQLDTNQILEDFESFSRNQIDVMSGFPCGDYHFLIQALPYWHYHGVEHQNSTTITLGPSSDLGDSGLYQSLLGISSHELFHTWNVIRIRPKEMNPYDFSMENYFETGYVAEGFTTYYGDLFLVKSGVLDVDWYMTKVNTMLRRYYENFGRYNMSVAESSKDLWLDGYSAGIPNRKVSIYNEGAIVALMLDLQIRVLTNHNKCLDDVMRELWKRHGQTALGYETCDIIDILHGIENNHPWQKFFDCYVYGVEPINTLFPLLLESFGFKMLKYYSEKKNESHWGFRIDDKNQIVKIQPNSIAEEKLSIGDVLENIEEALESQNDNVSLRISRNFSKIDIILPEGIPQYFECYMIDRQKEITYQQLYAMNKWLRK